LVLRIFLPRRSDCLWIDYRESYALSKACGPCG
jgi:hypothetical protein